MAREINRWWTDYPDEIYWFETTDRDDIGGDLNAPAEKESGGDYWSYNLVQEVRPGDIVATTSSPRERSSHGLGSPEGRDLDGEPRLDGPYGLSEAVTLTSLRQQANELAAIKTALEEREQGPIYFPFQFYGAARELRGFSPI